MRPQLTAAQADALKWLREHGGDGMFDVNGVLLAQGELAPVRRITWNRLAAIGLVQFYGGKRDGGRGRGRMRLVEGPR